MALSVIPLFRARERAHDWTQQELAEFYRVESALVQGGLQIESDRGLTDEGDPWFVFCRADTGEPVAHFARTGGEYLIASPAYQGVTRGANFRALVENLIGRHKLLQDVHKPSNGNIFLHPAALLIAIVGTAFFKVADARAADSSDSDGSDASGAAPAGHADADVGLTFFGGSVPKPGAEAAAASHEVIVEINRNYALVILAAATFVFEHPFEAGDLALPAAVADLVLETASLAQIAAARVADLSFDVPDALARDHVVAAQGSDVSGQLVGETTSLVALLKDLPAARVALQDVAPTGNAPTGPHEASGAPDAQSGITIAPSVDVDVQPPHSVAVVHLVATDGDLPQVRAVKLVTELAQAAHIEVSVPTGDLSSALASVIEHGSVVLGNGGATQFLLHHQDIFGLDTTPATPTPAPAASTTTDTPADPQATTTAPVTPDPKVVLSTAGAQQGTDANADTVSSLLSDYLHSNPGAKLIITQNSFVFVPSDFGTATTGLESFTVKFEDGSSISLVGQHAALQHIFDVIS